MTITTWEANANLSWSTAAQTPGAGTRTYLTGSALTIPATKLQIGTVLRWRIHATKSAAGTAACTFEVCFGTAGGTADTARVSFVKPAGTAAADDAWISIDCIVRGPLSGSGVVVGTFRLIHNLSATGHATIPCVILNTVSGAFDVTVASLIAGVAFTAGAAEAYTIQQVNGMIRNV